MARRVLPVVVLLLLVSTAGCTTLFGSDVGNEEDLSREAEYDFDTDRAASITVNRENYTAVYDVSKKVTGDEDTIYLYRTDALAVERPLEVHALQFRYPNGTLVVYEDGQQTRVYENGTRQAVSTLNVTTSNQRTVVELPHDEGKLAFTTPKNGKRIAVETPVHGSYEVALPPDTDASIPLLSQVRPANDDRERVDGRVHLMWEDVDSSVLVVRWYLERDLWLFGGLIAVAIVAGILGSVYYYLQIRDARERREEEGLDVDTDDDRRRPPPGMG